MLFLGARSQASPLGGFPDLKELAFASIAEQGLCPNVCEADLEAIASVGRTAFWWVGRDLFPPSI